MDQFVIISGCSSGGKSTLLIELGRRGHTVVEEPGRRIVKAELEGNGAALPWVNPTAFVRRAIEVALADLASENFPSEGWVFFDRGLVDVAAGLQHLTREPALEKFCQSNRYHKLVFLTPPWPEIFVKDPERRHGFDEAAAEYSRLLKVYPALGYELIILPKTTVAKRADFMLDKLAM